MKHPKTILVSALTIALFSLTLISGCKKEARETCTDGVKNGTETRIDCGGSCNVCAADVRIKTMTRFNATDSSTKTYSYTYDSQGRVETYKSPGPGTQTYTYYSDRIITTGNYLLETYFLNNYGFVDSLQIAVGSNIGYAYWPSSDAEGQRTGEIWSAGNLVSRGQQSFTYLTDKMNTIGYQNEGKVFMGKDSKNLISVATIGNVDIIHTYQFDAQNRVSQDQYRDQYGNDITTNYIYY